MTMHLSLPHVGMAALTCLLLSLAGGLFQTRAALQWFAGLRRARWHLPFASHFVVQALVYLIEGVVLYRLLESEVLPPMRVAALTALLLLMIAAEGASAALLGLRSVEAGMAATLALLAPLAVAEVTLWQVDPFGGWLMLPYCVWLVVYLTPWSVSLCRLNRTARGPAAENE